MANVEQLKALIKCHAEGDNDRFYSIALQIAAKAAKQGHSKMASELRALVDSMIKDTKEQGPHLQSKTIHISSPRGEIKSLLSVSHPNWRLGQVVLPSETKEKLERILVEQRQQSKLINFGLFPKRRILLIGPPGTGKTMTAGALAGELHLPLCTIQLDALITKYMGETASKLRLIFDNFEKVRAVYFFDEFDAIGSHRNSTNDIGEIRRVLNSFLQFIEQINSPTSLIIAATNNANLLDNALFRRFDDVIFFQIPDEDLCKKVILNRLALLDAKNINWKEVCKACEGLSYSEIVRACDEAVKDIILNDSKTISTNLLVKMLNERQVFRKQIK